MCIPRFSSPGHSPAGILRFKLAGGVAGLSAAYTLKKRGFAPVLLEAEARVGDALPETGDGFSVDTGAAFLCSSYDVAFRICEVLGLSLVRSAMRLGWYGNGRWVTTTPGLSVGNLVRNLPAASALGFLSPRVMCPGSRCVPFIRLRLRHPALAGQPGALHL